MELRTNPIIRNGSIETGTTFAFRYSYVYAIKIPKELIRQKVKVPKFIKEFIELRKKQNVKISKIFDRLSYSDDFYSWLNTGNNDELFIQAWVNGCEAEAEKPKRFKFKIVPSGISSYLNYSNGSGQIFADAGGNPWYQTEFTESEWESLQKEYPNYLPKYDTNDPRFEEVDEDAN
jgi:hypothetical protein